VVLVAREDKVLKYRMISAEADHRSPNDRLGIQDELEPTVTAHIIDRRCARDLAKRAEAKLLGFGGCLACKTNPCRYKSYGDEKVLQEQKDELSREIFLKRAGRPVTATSIHSRHCNYSIDMLQRELKIIDNQLALTKVDSELHAAYQSMHSFVEIESLHGYKTHVATDNAISALLREHDRLVAASVSDEVVDGILDWMKEGWYFGETSSSSSGPSTTSSTAITASTATARPSSDGPLQEISDISNEARIRHQREQIVKHQQERQNELNDAEKNVKFSLFMLTFMYFRSLHVTKVAKIKLSGEFDIVGPKQRNPIPTERLRMIQEEELAQARRERMKDAMSRAKEGEATRMQQKKEKDEHRLVILRHHYRKHNLNKSALVIQRTFRGHIARKAVIMWRHRKAEIEASNALYNACATAISRYWRGHKGRTEANVLRREMAEFLIAMRSSDLQDNQRERQKRRNGLRKRLG